jgi:hypothetical protein
MGLESATFISQLVDTNPVVGDAVSQGDDHIRLVKDVLQNTFPNASKALYFPTSLGAQTATINPNAAAAGKIYPVDATAGGITVNLPATPDDGYEITVVKIDSTANAVTIDPASAVLINGASTITLVNQFETARCIYLATYAAWVALRGPKTSPFDAAQAAAEVWPIANGGTGQATAPLAFDALSVARVDVASAATVDLGAAASSYIRITGTTNITAITLAAGVKRWVVFDDVLTLTQGASLLLPSGASIITAAGDTALFVGEAAGIVRCQFYSPVSGQPLVISAATTVGALIAIIEDQKAQNTAGGTFTSGADQTRTLNTLVYNRDSLVSLSSNQFTLPAGNWEIEWVAPAFAVDGHQSWLYDVTNAAVAARGSTEVAGVSSAISTHSIGRIRLTISGSTIYQIRHRCITTKTTSGFGSAANLGSEVYTRVSVRRG